MENQLLHKTQTGIAAEYFVAAELSRRGFNVGVTISTTKALDLLVEKNNKKVAIQVKGIQRQKSLCWNFNDESLKSDLIFVLVNLHADTLSHPEYFIMTRDEINTHLKRVKSGRHYLDYNYVKELNAENAWNKI